MVEMLDTDSGFAASEPNRRNPTDPLKPLNNAQTEGAY